ncbi:STM4015 family protein [uncultured Massilia sp.]|uniref:STM4015 family protein n=1 Tax=uncultured Massilia sp. TaxID=169973 RepID=UPI0025902F5E|nr:STM4015 family protein [uncultured Massilia sp.]
MTISEPTETFFDKPLRNYESGTAPDIGQHVYRLALEYDDSRKMTDLIDEFLGKIDPAQLDALVIGMWAEPYEAGADELIATLVARAPALTGLRALFIGDMTYEECEISWIVQGDYAPLLNAFPQLEVLRIRGANGLSFAPFTHPALRSFTIESGGLPDSVAEALAGSSMPQLAHLELWLGTEDYGFSGDVALYRRVADALWTPSLTYLGLRNSEIADDLAQWLAGHEPIRQLDTLDLSLGTISDVGARALIDSPHVRALRRLDLSHHYISEALQTELNSLPCQVVLDDAQDEDGEDFRYVAVGE